MTRRPKRTAKPRAFNEYPPTNPNTIVLAKRTPPTSSWWAEARTREEFNEKLRERLPELKATHGLLPHGGQ